MAESLLLGMHACFFGWGAGFGTFCGIPFRRGWRFGHQPQTWMAASPVSSPSAVAGPDEDRRAQQILRELDLGHYARFCRVLRPSRLIAGYVSASDLRGLGFTPREIDKLLGWARSASEEEGEWYGGKTSPLLRLRSRERGCRRAPASAANGARAQRSRRLAPSTASSPTTPKASPVLERQLEREQSRRLEIEAALTRQEVTLELQKLAHGAPAHARHSPSRQPNAAHAPPDGLSLTPRPHARRPRGRARTKSAAVRARRRDRHLAHRRLHLRSRHVQRARA